MKNLRSILLALTVLLLATAAQAQTTNVKASIPFDFVVGDHAYSAGEYTVKSLSQSSAAIRIDNADESEKGMTLSNACQKAQPATRTTLVFQRLGDNYFLYQVWTEGNSAWPRVPDEQDAGPACQELQQAGTRDRCRKHLPLTPRHSAAVLAPRKRERLQTFPLLFPILLRRLIRFICWINPS